MKSLASLLVISLFIASCSKSTTTDEDSTGGGGGGTTPCSGKLIFATSVPDGNFGGASGADTICNANKPTGYSGSTFKAYVGDVGSRAACYVSGNDTCYTDQTGRVDWPLAASTTYCNEATTTIGTTGTDALMSATGYIDSAHTYKYYTGFNIAYGISTSNNCADYSTTGGAASTAGLTNGGFGASTSLACNSAAGYIACVEQ